MDTILKATVRGFFEMLTSKRATVSYADNRDASRLSAMLVLMNDLAHEAPNAPNAQAQAALNAARNLLALLSNMEVQPGEASINGMSMSKLNAIMALAKQFERPKPAAPAKESEPTGSAEGVKAPG